MKKAPKIKGYAGGGEIPKFKSRKEFDDYYTGLGYKADPLYNQTGAARYYDPTKLTFDEKTKQYSGVGMNKGAWTSTPEASYFAEYKAANPISNAAPGKAIVEDTGRKPVFTGNQYYDTYQYADKSGQYGNAETKYIDKKTGAFIDPAKSFDAKGNYVPATYKLGGLVKKIKGYQNGTTEEGVEGQDVVNESGFKQNKFKQGQTDKIGALSQLGNLGGSYLQSESLNANGTVDPEQAALAGGLKGGAKGAQIGMMFGPQGAAVGAGLGALTGAGMSYFGAKNLNRDIEFGNTLAKNETAYAEQAGKFSSALNKQMQERMAGMKDGGVVKGKGTGTSDSINAKVEEGSFVVPAKNGLLAEQVRKVVLKAPSAKKKANLNQSSGVPVKLSNGEHLFSPEEKEKIAADLGVDFLENLAPDAKTKLREHLNCGGTVKGYADGGEVDGDPNKINFNEVYETNKKKDIIRKAKLMETRTKLMSSNSPQKDLYLNQINSELSDINKKYNLKENEGLSKEEIAKITPAKKSIPSKTGAEIEQIMGTKSAPKIGKSKVTPDVMQSKTPELVVNTQEKEITPQGTVTADETTVTPETKKSFDYGKALNLGASQLGSLANYFLPYKQYKMGQQFLAEAGDRPKDRIDPDFQNAVNRAQVNAQYGYTPEEQAILQQQNINALRAGQNAAQNYSGGSGATAFNLTRQAANDYYLRGLKGLASGKNLQLDKQALADNLIQNKAQMSRQLFNDNMNAWLSKQQAGGNLVGSAINNALQVNRYNQEKQFQDELAAKSNPWVNYMQ